MTLPEILEPLHPLFMAASFVLGALVGSFCNVCVARWPAGESVVRPRSRCPKCREAIAWYDNIPVLSWLVLGARCRNCGAPISWQYPVVEALTATLFLFVYWRFGFVLATPVYMALCAGLIIVTFQDLADWTIPNQITIPFTALAGIVLGGGTLWLLDRVTVLILKKPGMGFGDVKLLAMLGAFLGWQGVLGILMMASILGSIVGVTTILVLNLGGHEEEESGDEEAEETPDAPPAKEDEADEAISLKGHYLPFGPYLALAGLLYMFFGPEVIAAYITSLQPEPLVAPRVLP